MSKICIIGNSHLGALAQAERGNKAFADAGYDLVYWGAAGLFFPRIKYEDGRLISPKPERSRLISSGRYGHLDIDDFDIIIFYGCHAVISKDSKAIAKRMEAVKSLSTSFQAAALEEQLQQWWDDLFIPTLIGKVISGFPNKRYLFTPEPLFANNENYISNVKDQALLRAIQERMGDMCESWSKNSKIAYCKQNKSTIFHNGITTDPRFTYGSVKMEAKEAHPEDDFTHMNSAYGEVVMEDLLEMISQPAAGLETA